MVENNQDNDEYKFEELDPFDNSSIEEIEPDFNNPASLEGGPPTERKNIKRNAILVIVIIILAMVMYKLTGWMFFGKHNQSSLAPVAPAPQIAPQPLQTAVTPAPAPPSAPPQVQPEVNSSVDDLKQRVSAIEQSQQSMKMELSTVSEQAATINTQVNNLNGQIANLNQEVGNLANQLAKQSEEIKMVLARCHPQRVKVIKPVVKVPRVIYYIQAVIPGRAWLIGTNGSTLTVREGIKIPGYGIVRLIDSLQGRVLTSSGQIIRFSQEDS